MAEALTVQMLICQRQVHFLGHVVSIEGISTDPSKTNVVASWPIPHAVRMYRSFLVLQAIIYRCFVPEFAAIAKPLHRLTEKTAKFKRSL